MTTTSLPRPPTLPADGTKRTRRRMIRLTQRRRAYWIGDYYVDRSGWLSDGGRESYGPVLAAGRTDLSIAGQAAWLGAPLPVVQINRRRNRQRRD